MNEKESVRACARKTSIGGQALMEGIMMRGPKLTAIAVRDTKGQIVVEKSVTSISNRPKIFKLPIIRGVFGFIDSLTMGYKALMRSAELSGLEDIVEESPRKKKKREAAEAKAAAEAAKIADEQTDAEICEDAPVVEPETEEAPEVTEAEADAEAEAPVEVAEEPVAEAKEEKKKAKEDEKLPAWVASAMMIATTILGFGLMLALFIWLPVQLFEWTKLLIPGLETDNSILNSAIKSTFEGVVRILLLLGYMSLILLMKDIRRTFMYHGAEHKSIFCYEAGLDLTVENVRKQRRFHPRCGSSFLILMVFVGVVISFFIDPISILISGETLPTLLRSGVKLLLMPIIVGIGYELIKLAGRYDNWFTRLISLPGVWFQHITVFEPTDDMIECAIAALKPVIPQDGSDAW